jgi:mRNA interferase RelE/StbE
MEKQVFVFYTAHARKDLRRLEQADARRITLTVADITKKKPLEKAKQLSGLFQGLYRYRIGNYRVIFQCDDKGEMYILNILNVKHRKDAYR